MNDYNSFMGRVRNYPNLFPIALDIETDGTDPFLSSSKIVYVGLYNGKDYEIIYPYNAHDVDAALERLVPPWAEPLLVGHNIKFDLQFLGTIGGGSAYVEEDIYDTSVMEYMLSGQTMKFPSLDDCCKKWKLGAKEDKVKALLKAGVRVSDMDSEMVIEYLKKDLELTYKLYEHQLERAKRRPPTFFNNFILQMYALKAYVWLEINGLKWDRNGLVNAHFTCEQQLAANDITMQALLGGWGFIGGSANLTSNATISTLLWGSPGIKYDVNEYVGKYKNGKPKYKKSTVAWTPEFHLDPADFNVEKKAHGCYDVSEHMLEEMRVVLRNCGPGCVEADLLKYLDTLMDSRKIAKIDGTYFVPLIEQLDASTDRLVHPTINMTATSTGRTSANNPNSQNMPPLVRKYCIADKDGVLLESDFSQLEVCGLGQLTGDPQLTHDINQKVDIHFQTGKSVMRWKVPSDMDKRERRTVKGVNFGIIYGGGAPTISYQTGAGEELVKKLIASFYRRYPTIKGWQKNNIEAVVQSGQVTPDSPIIMGQYAEVGELQSITGRYYRFTQSLVPEKYRHNGVILNFKPTEIKNYPVQGFATGDVVPFTVGYLAYIVSRNFNGLAKLVNVVHDSLLWRCANEETAEKVRNLSDDFVSNLLPALLEDLFGINSTVHYSMDHEIKTNW